MSKAAASSTKKGRPFKKADDKLHRIVGWVPLYLLLWIRENGGSQFLRRLIEKAYNQRE